MANKLRGEVAVEHDKVQYLLRPTMQALLAIEGALDLGVLEVMRRLGTGDVRLRHLASVLRETSKEGGREIPAEAIGELITRDLGKASLAVVTVLSGAFGEADDGPKETATPAT